MIGKLNSHGIEEVITHQLVGHLGCHADNCTYVVPVSYGYDGTYIYVHTYEGMKIQMMRKNPKVCIQIDDRKDMANWRSVVAWGEYEELKEPLLRKEALQILNNRILPDISSSTTHISAHWPFNNPEMEIIDGIVFRILLSEKTGVYESTSKTPSYFL